MNIRIAPFLLIFFAINVIYAQNLEYKRVLERSRILDIGTLENQLKEDYKKGNFKNHVGFLVKTKAAFHKALAEKRYKEALSIYNMLGTEYNFDLTVDSTLIYKFQIEPFVKNIQSEAMLGRYLEIEGYTLYFQGDTKKAIPIFDKSIKYLKKVNDSTSTSWERAHFYSGYIFSFEDSFKDSFSHLSQALQLARYQKNYNLQRLARSVLATLYSQAYLFKEAAAEREEVIKLALKTGRKAAVASAYINFSSDEEEQGNSKKSYKYLLKAKSFTDPKDHSATSFFYQLIYWTTI